MLAQLLVNQNVHVEFLTYNKDEFLKKDVEGLGIYIHTFNEFSKIKKFFKIRKFLKKSSYDIVISYLSTPNMISEISNLTKNKWKLIVSERNQNFPRFYVKGLFHHLSDRVVLNSNASFEELRGKTGLPKNKYRIIHNGLDFSRFYYKDNSYKNNQITIIAKYSQQKNIFRLIESVILSKDTFRKFNYKIEWYGDLTKNKKGIFHVYEDAKKIIVENGLSDIINLNEKSSQMVNIYNKSDALLLPSIFEGLPNVILEGMACKLPILMSRVSDFNLLVNDNDNGYLFDPFNVKDLSRVLEKFIIEDSSKKRSMGNASYQILKKNFSNQIFLKKYMKLFEEIL